MAIAAPHHLVLDRRLETEFFNGRIRHTRYVQGSTSRQRQKKVKETWDIRQSLGQGSFGVVRLEALRPSPSRTDAALRAVKVIAKLSPTQGRWNYLNELETVFKFSHEKYIPYFVRTSGWFEDDESVYITLDYFPLGDLQKFMRELPPFDEDAARKIIRQLLEGIGLMHASGFAHRDLKPGNILVEYAAPEWLIKIADFGISKQAEAGGTDLRTMQIGTFGYMAPEVLGYFSGNDSNVAYSVTVDIWSIGVIATELLLKRRPFSHVREMNEYILGANSLSLNCDFGTVLTGPCQDFLHQLLSPNPITRPTAGAARNHPWIEEGTSPEGWEEESPSASENTPEPEPMVGIYQAATPASLVLSTLQASNDTVATGTLLPTYQGHQLDVNILLPCFRHLTLEQTR